MTKKSGCTISLCGPEEEDVDGRGGGNAAAALVMAEEGDTTAAPCDREEEETETETGGWIRVAAEAEARGQEAWQRKKGGVEDGRERQGGVLDAEPPEWMPDSAALSCMQCGDAFRALTCARHHCRFCGGIFCGSCSSARCLLPVRFLCRNPQRVCDSCYAKLEAVQSSLMTSVSNASQVATHDVTDSSCIRAWFNSPVGVSMQQEIYKATNTLRNYTDQIGKLQPQKCIPHSVVRAAKGLAIITEIKAGMIVTYKLGTGLVLARRLDGTWSAPSAIVSCGLGWGAQVGGELTDFIIVLQNKRAVQAFGGRLHLSMGAGASAAVGLVGRVAEADVRAGDGGAAACYTYSCSKGAFVGCSLEGNVVATRYPMNTRFYGDPCVTAQDILFGSVPRPNAATPLYSALDALFEKLHVQAT